MTAILGHLLKHRTLMTRALEHASRRHLDLGESPALGCIVVSNGQIIGEQFAPADGAENPLLRALAEAAGKTQGATVYLTHDLNDDWQVQLACLDQLIDARVGEVVVPARLSKSIAALGLDRLTRAGIRVISGVCAHQATAIISRQAQPIAPEKANPAVGSLSTSVLS